MIPTLPFVEEKYSLLNDLCFQGELPSISIKLTKARTFLGKVAYKGRRNFWGKTVCNEDFSLRISTLFDLSETEWEDVILHEQIHYYIALHLIRDTSAHGQVFRSMMKSINEKYGRHITVRHHSGKGLISPPKERESCICISRLRDGNLGITRCTENKKAEINRKLPIYYRLSSMTWYRTSDPFFNKYPLSRTPKIYKITQGDLANLNITIFV